MSTSTGLRRASLLLLCAVALVVVGFLLGRLSAGPGATGAGASGVDVLDDTALVIRGTATDELRPGTTSPIDVAVTNRGDRALVVSDLVVEIVELTAPQADGEHPCTRADFVLAQAPTSLTMDVGARSTTSLSDAATSPATWPHIELLDRPVDQDGCKGATVTLAFAAVGTPS